MISKDYSAVLGSFRLRNNTIIKQILGAIPGQILLDTGVSYNIDHVLTDLDDKYLDRIDICTKYGVDHLKDFDFYTTNHLRFLRKKSFKYALVHFYEDGWKDLVRAMMADPRIETVGLSNFSIDQIEEYHEEFGEYPAVLEFEFSRRYHDTELTKYCRDHNIEMLGYGVLGGIHASKQYIREYLLEDLLGYARLHNVIPIIRTDCFQHFCDDMEVYSEVQRGQTQCDFTMVSESNHYNLSADTKDDRALNKFKYDKPKHLIKLVRENMLINTLDSATPNDLGFERLVRPITNAEFSHYHEVDREFMMVTDYLVKKKFEMSELDHIVCSDDLLINYDTGDLYSYNLLADDGCLIKSGSEHAKVYELNININD